MTKLFSRLKRNTIPSFQNNRKKTSMDTDKDDYAEIEMIEVPIVKKMIFQLKKPVKLEFS